MAAATVQAHREKPLQHDLQTQKLETAYCQAAVGFWARYLTFLDSLSEFTSNSRHVDRK